MKESLPLIGAFIVGIYGAGYLFLDSTYQAIHNRDETLRIMEQKDLIIYNQKMRLDYFDKKIKEQTEKDKRCKK